MNLPLRNDLAGLSPYESFDTPVSVRLNTNENPYSVPEVVKNAVVKKVADAITDANRYPNDNFLQLRQSLSDYLHALENLRFDPTQLIAANGSNEVMQEIFSAFAGPGRTCLSFSPAYSMYPQFCRDSFTQLVQVPRIGDDFTIAVDEAVRKIEEIRPSIIIITNPNNPTGTFTCIDDLRRILHAAQNTGVQGADDAHPVVVIDEAYSDFRASIHRTSLELLDEFPNLIVVKTLSKAFAFAGVRLGFAIAAPEIIQAMRIVRLPYNLSAITQAVVIAALEYAPQMLNALDEIKAQRDFLSQALNRLEYHGEKLIVVPSQANFIQIGFNRKLPNFQELPQNLHAFMLEHGVLIRKVGAPGFFRVTVGKPHENMRFLELLDAWLKK
jgi:histidinol-phosphate aminotransferase